MLTILSVLLLLVVLFVIGMILNGGMYLLAKKLGWFEIQPTPVRWYDKFVYQIQYRLWRRWESQA